MTRWAVLLRGINVGGHNKVPMAELRDALTADGFGDVATYIASGNIVLTADASPVARVGAVMARRFGLELAVMARTAEQVRSIVAANPFPDLAAAEPRFVHCHLASAPIDESVIGGIDIGPAPERVAVAAGVLFVAYPNGSARSKLTTALIERVVGAPTTGRNWNTVRKLEEMVTAAGG